jgi:signal transduction histidine kinase
MSIIGIPNIYRYIQITYKSFNIYTELVVRNMLRPNISSLKNVISKEIKALASVFNGSNSEDNKAKDFSEEKEILLLSNNRKRKNYVECFFISINGSICYELREDGTIKIL